MGRLAGKKAVVLGAASKDNMGQTIARLFAREGAEVMVAGRKEEPLKALAMLVLLFSLAGVPPMLGFFAKFGVFLAAVDAGLTALAVAGAVASVIGAFYYLRIVYFMYFGAERDAVESRMAPAQWALLVASASVMVLGVANLFGIEAAAAAAADILVR